MSVRRARAWFVDSYLKTVCVLRESAVTLCRLHNMVKNHISSKEITSRRTTHKSIVLRRVQLELTFWSLAGDVSLSLSVHCNSIHCRLGSFISLYRFAIWCKITKYKPTFHRAEVNRLATRRFTACDIECTTATREHKPLTLVHISTRLL